MKRSRLTIINVLIFIINVLIIISTFVGCYVILVMLPIKFLELNQYWELALLLFYFVMGYNLSKISLINY